MVALYDAEMPTRGWEPSVAPSPGQDQRAYARPGADLLVITSKDGDRTIVSVIEMRGKVGSARRIRSIPPSPG